MCKSINNTQKKKKKVNVLVGKTGSLVKYEFQINDKIFWYKYALYENILCYFSICVARGTQTARGTLQM